MRLYKPVHRANGFVRVLPIRRKTRRRQVLVADGHVELTRPASLHCILDDGPCTNSAMQLKCVPHGVEGVTFDSHVVRAEALFKGGQFLEVERL